MSSSSLCCSSHNASAWQATYERVEKEGIKFLHYQNVKGPIKSSEYKYVICEYESISRIEGTFDLVVIDEQRSLVETIQSATNGLKTLRHWEMLKNFTLHASKVLYLDADMECDQAAYDIQDMLAKHDATVAKEVLTQAADHMERLYPHKKAERDALVVKAHDVKPPLVHRIVNTTQKMKRCNVVSTTPEMLYRAARLLDEGKRIVLCCASLKSANMYASYLSAHTTSLGFYTSETDNKDDVKTLQKCWDKFQCIIFTSTITTGADYNYMPKISDIAPVEEVFLFPHHNSCTPRDMCQMAGRIRHIETGDIYIAVSEEVMLVPTTREKIDKMFDDELKLIEGCSDRLHDILSKSVERLKFTLPPDVLARSYKQTPHELMVIGAYSRAERRFTKSNQQWMSMYMYLSNKKGYTLRYADGCLTKSDMIGVMKELKVLSAWMKHDAVVRMNAIDVQGFREDVNAYRQLRHLASGLHLCKADTQEFRRKFDTVDMSPIGLNEALQKATAARLFANRPHEKIDAAFVKYVKHHERSLQLHNIDKHMTNEKLIDFLMKMKSSDVPELRATHIVPLYQYTSELIKALGGKCFGDRSTVIDSESATCNYARVKNVLKVFNMFNVYTKGETDFKKAADVLLKVADIELKDKKPLKLSKSLGSLLKEQTYDQSAWFSDKWGIAVPVHDTNKPRETDSVTRLNELLEMYKDHEGDVFDSIRTDIHKRLNSKLQLESDKRVEQCTKSTVHLRKQKRKLADVDYSSTETDVQFGPRHALVQCEQRCRDDDVQKVETIYKRLNIPVELTGDLTSWRVLKKRATESDSQFRRRQVKRMLNICNLKNVTHYTNKKHWNRVETPENFGISMYKKLSIKVI
jgi:hypothetical protein